MGEWDADLAHFARFLARAQAERSPSGKRTYYATWRAQNTGEASAWDAFRDAVLAGTKPTPPVLASHFGASLVVAAEMHMSISRLVGAMTPATPPPVVVVPPDPPPPPPTGGVLRYTPPGYPNYVGYTTINVPASGPAVYNLNDSLDYKVNLGDYTGADGVHFTGGRNVVCIGGRITTTGISGQSSNLGLMLWPRGNAYYHFEGIRIRPSPTVNSGTNLHDGVVLRHTTGIPVLPGARVILQNMRVGTTAIKIGFTDAQGHADTMQFQSDFPAQVKVDKFTALYDYNSIMISNFTIGGLELHRWNWVPTDANPSYSGFLFVYQGVPANQPVSFDDVWGTPGPGRTFTNSFFPTSLAASANEGLPSGGDFCKETDCGVSYSPPGYV